MSTLTRTTKQLGNEHYWVLTGPEGAATWGLLLGDTYGPICAHSLNPLRDEHDKGECEFTGSHCYDAESLSSYGRDIGLEWEKSGRDDELIWAALEEWYNERLRNNTFVPVDPKAALARDNSPTALREHEFRHAFGGIADGQSIYDVIRACYRSRRKAFVRAVIAGSTIGAEREAAWRNLCDLYANHLDDIEAAYGSLDRLADELLRDDKAAVEATLDYLTGVRA